MKVSIRASKYQKQEMSIEQLAFANACVIRYVKSHNKTEFTYSGELGGKSLGCDIYRTKTQVSAIVYFNLPIN